VEQRQTFRKGETMTIRGYIPLGAFRFAIEIGHSDEDLALHFNPRFSGRHIVLNSRQKWSWGQEQRETNFPFQPGKEFKVRVLQGGNPLGEEGIRAV
ncbi:LEG protein, partial [Amia calva]|nr:LEG protein [Amia calva]